MLDFITTDATEFGSVCLAFSVGSYKYRQKMDKTDSKRILWENVKLLMQRDFGEENLGKVAEAAGFSPANMTRIKAQDTDVSLKVLEGLERAFDIPVWQLLAPRLGAHLHVVEGNRVEPLFDLKVIGDKDAIVKASRTKGKKNERNKN